MESQNEIFIIGETVYQRILDCNDNIRMVKISDQEYITKNSSELFIF